MAFQIVPNRFCVKISIFRNKKVEDFDSHNHNRALSPLKFSYFQNRDLVSLGESKTPDLAFI